MKIVFIIPNMTGGGTERVISLLANEFAKRGIEVTIMMFAGNECVYKIDSKVELLCVSKQSHGNIIIRINRIRSMRKFFKQNEGCYIFSFCVMGTVFGALATIGLNCPLLVAERTDPRSSGHTFIRNIAYARARRLIVQTEDCLNYLPYSFRRKSAILPNPVDENIPIPFEGNRKNTVVYLGRLEPEKNPMLLLDAFVEFSDKFPYYQLHFYGRGSLEEKMKQYIKAHNIADKVTLHGFCKDAKQKIVDSKIFVLPSNYEGISNSMVEAMAMGLPVIATDCPIGGAAAYIRDGENGVLVPVGDSKKMAEAMIKIASNPEFAKNISINCRKIREECPVDVIADRLLEIAGIKI